MITNEQMNFISSNIEKSRIVSKELKDDLLDHFCCLIEDEMKKGTDFQSAYQLAFRQVTPNGFDEIHQETIFLLNRRKIILLKRLIYATGYLFTLISTVGLFFKKMYWPGATMLLIIGIVGLLGIFLPLKLLDRFKIRANKLMSERKKWLIASITIGLLGVATLMTVTHTTGGSYVLSVAVIGIGFGILPYLFFKMYKKSTGL